MDRGTATPCRHGVALGCTLHGHSNVIVAQDRIAAATQDISDKRSCNLHCGPTPFSGLETPRSMAMSWIRRGLAKSVAIDEDSHIEQQLRSRMPKLGHLIAELRLALAMLPTSGVKLGQTTDAGRFLPCASRFLPTPQDKRTPSTKE